MAIQIRRGTDSEWETNNSNIVAGEPAVAMDSERMFVGTGSGTYMELANIEAIADAFGASASYAVGDYCVYQGKYYTFTTAHTGSWNSSDVSEVTINDAIALKADKTEVGTLSNLTTTNKTDVVSAINEVKGDIPSVPSPSDANPQMDGTASAGTSGDYSRADHVHPTDTSRASVSEVNALTDVVDIPLSMSGTDNPFGSGVWLNLVTGINLKKGKSYTFSFVAESSYTGTISVQVSTGAGGTPQNSSIASASMSNGSYSLNYTPTIDFEGVRLRIYGATSNTNVTASVVGNYNNAIKNLENDMDSALSTIGNQGNAIENIESDMDSTFDIVHTVFQGWSAATEAYQKYYATYEKISIASGETITAKTGFQVALTGTSGTLVAWTSAITAGQNYSDVSLIIRRTGRSSEMPLEETGYFLSDYIAEDYTATDEKCNTLCLSGSSFGVVREKIIKGADNSKWTNKKAGFIGDSITAGQSIPAGGIYYEVADEMIGFSSVYTDGVAGSSFSGVVASSYTPIVQRISSIPTDCDLVVLFGGTNDWGRGTPIGTVDDTTDISFCGAVAKSIIDVMSANPNVRLILITPLHRAANATYGWLADYEENSAGKTLKDYVDAIKEVGEKYSIPVIDMFSYYGINPNISALNTEFFFDGLHPNAKGHKILGTRIVPFINMM